MRIFVAGPPGLTVLAQQPWVSLMEGLQDQHDLVHSIELADGLVSFNHQQPVLRAARKREIPVNRRALIMMEPSATLPWHGGYDLRANYFHIYCASPIWAERVGGESFLWPQESEPRLDPVDPNGVSEFRATMVAAQKRSAMKSSLYSLRRGVVRDLGQLGIPIGLAGTGWDESRLQRWNRGSRALARAVLANPSEVSLTEAYGRVDSSGVKYVGPVGDKFIFMQRAPMAIVIENSLDYLSEKLFDAIRAGVAPIYVGPPLSDFGVPERVALAARPLVADIVHRVCDTTVTEIAACIGEGQAWLAAEEYRLHDSRVVLRSLGEKIGAALANSASSTGKSSGQRVLE